jgi:hypothetical protein
MRRQVVIAVLVGAFAGAAAASVFVDAPIRFHAFGSEGQAVTRSAYVARLNRPVAATETTVEVEPVTIVARRASRAVVRDATPLTCHAWRPLLTGPGAADADAPVVRECDPELLGDRTVAAPSTRAQKDTARPIAPRQHWIFTVDMGAPR